MINKPLTKKNVRNTHLIRSGLIAIITLALLNCGTVPERIPPTQQPDEAIGKAPIKSTTAPARFPSADAPPPAATILTPTPPPTVDPAKELVQTGRYLDAALLLSDMAYSLPAPARQDYLLRVTTLLLQGNYIQQADQILNSIDIQGLPEDYHTKKAVLSAELALAKQDPNTALQLLNSLATGIQSSTIDNQKDYYRARIDVDMALSNYADIARTRAALEPLLTDSEEIKENQATLLRDLQNLTDQQLSSLHSQTIDPTWLGWIELALIARQVHDEQQAQDQVAQWQQKHLDHPVNQSIIDTIILRQPEALGRPTQIAMIIPTKGKFAKAADAIRDGFLAAYYAEGNQNFHPSIKFYDEGEDPAEISNIAQQAISNGADFIVGPLSKTAVTNLAKSGNATVGVLTLNYGDTELLADHASNFFQMSLSPEQEAMHVAEHAWLDGHTNAAAIYPGTTWGTRVYSAFKERWEELGGVVVEHQTYDTQNSDYKVPIKQLLNLDESDDRFAAIHGLVNEKLQFEPRRRKDVDFIFMAAFARQGRLLRPQLKFHRATEIPVYSTSHVYSGQLQPRMDSDMNDVKFSDMPWALIDNSRNKEIKRQIAKLWPDRSSRYMRLFALGVDAYQILPELGRMRRNRFATYQGETGTLYLDVANRLQRKLLWAQFDDGKPKILAEF